MFTSAWTSSFCEETDTYSPAAIEHAPAARPARPVSTMVCALPPPPPTPAISDTLVTSPSMAPNTAGRSQPPDTSRWWCPLIVSVRVGPGSLLGSHPDCVPFLG